jgi:molybdopterin synthase catalytic subunit
MASPGPDLAMTRRLEPPEHGDWIDVTTSVLPVDLAWSWASRRDCGAVVTFCGTVRDHSDGRPGVTQLEYEAYAEQVIPRLTGVARAARDRWEEIGRLVLLHRIGLLVVGEVSVVVVASTPHRAEAFAAAQFCIDTLKETVPIWKRETWVGGTNWTTCAQEGHGAAARGGPEGPAARAVSR